MPRSSLLNWLIATVWFLNGLFFKILDLVPRHEAIVAEILGSPWSREWTIFIGIGEVVMSVWVISTKWSRFNAIVQIALILGMNILEFVLVPELLLWGRFNLLFAIGFCLLIYWNAFLRKRFKPQIA